MKNTPIEVLHNSGQIHKKLKTIIAKSQDGKRIILVAYVGQDAENYLPNPKELRIICTPQAGATSPKAIRKLIKRGATVEFADNLHMKVYWTSKHGAIIGSPNLSSNALTGKLKEAAVFMPSDMVDIEELIAYAQPRPVTQSELSYLDIETRKFNTRTPNTPHSKGAAIDFLTWFGMPMRESWKLAPWSIYLEQPSVAAIDMTESLYGKGPYDFVGVRKDYVVEGDWLLQFHLGKKGVTKIQWMYVDFVVPINVNEPSYDPDYCYQAVQVNELSKYPSPPFRVSTKAFREAFLSTVAKYGEKTILSESGAMPSKRLLSQVVNSLSRD